MESVITRWRRITRSLLTTLNVKVMTYQTPAYQISISGCKLDSTTYRLKKSSTSNYQSFGADTDQPMAGVLSTSGPAVRNSDRDIMYS